MRGMGGCLSRSATSSMNSWVMSRIPSIIDVSHRNTASCVSSCEGGECGECVRVCEVVYLSEAVNDGFVKKLSTVLVSFSQPRSCTQQHSTHYNTHTLTLTLTLQHTPENTALYTLSHPL